MDDTNPTIKKNLDQIEEWSTDVFHFAQDTLGMKASEPIDSLRGKPIHYTDAFGVKQTTLLFDLDGRLVYHDLAFYTIDMFKNQDKESFKRQYKGKRYTWQQTIALEGYNRAIRTFNKDSFDMSERWISICSGHGIGKTALLCTISLHFLICFFGAQIGATANTEQQLKDIFLKELYFWRDKLPEGLKNNIEVLDDLVRIVGTKDWFLRARVARAEKPEALAGLHGEYVLILVDEASGVPNMIFEVMKGALTGQNYIVVYTSNPTRTEGEFYDSQKSGSTFTRLKFTSRESPIVKDSYVTQMEEDYGAGSDTVKIRVDGEFAGIAEMDEKGWIPLFGNMTIFFEPQTGQKMHRVIIGVDPAGQGRDRSIIHIRDNVYLKEVLNERTSTEKDLARKIETIRDAYHSSSSDVAIEAFGIGAKVVANVQSKMGESVNAILTDKPREEVKDKFHTFKSELAWKAREWLIGGGIIITNNQKEWIREFEKIKYKRDLQGRIMLMPKIEFKKLHGFSPDRFDAMTMTFFKENPVAPVILTKEQLEQKENEEWLQRIQQSNQKPTDNLSSM